MLLKKPPGALYSVSTIPTAQGDTKHQRSSHSSALDIKMMIIEILAPFLGSLLLPLNNKGQYVGEVV